VTSSGSTPGSAQPGAIRPGFPGSPGSPPPLTITKDVLIRGITHTFDATTGAWLTTWTLQDAARFTGFLILDSPTQGSLNVNMLAY
jgi:hypothetical protein